MTQHPTPKEHAFGEDAPQNTRGYCRPRNTQGLISSLCIAVSLLASLLLFVAPASAATNAPSSSKPHTICADASIPREWVVLKVTTDWSQCGGFLRRGLLFPLDNVYLVGPAPAQTTTVCDAITSSIPANYVVTRENPDFLTCGLSTRAYTITPLHNQRSIDICSDSPIPTGWVVTAAYTPLDRPRAILICDRDILDADHLIQKTLAPDPTTLTQKRLH